MFSFLLTHFTNMSIDRSNRHNVSVEMLVQWNMTVWQFYHCPSADLVSLTRRYSLIEQLCYIASKTIVQACVTLTKRIRLFLQFAFLLDCLTDIDELKSHSLLLPGLQSDSCRGEVWQWHLIKGQIRSHVIADDRNQFRTLLVSYKQTTF